MRILFLAEGDAESWSCWSGITKSIVDQLRANGHTVVTGNVALRPAGRYVAALSTLSFNRQRWGTRFRLGAVAFRLRSRRADACLAACRDRVDAIIQAGATFRLSNCSGLPYYVCCDSNIRAAQHGASSGYSDGSAISAAELEGIAVRERAVYEGAAGIFPLSELLRRSFIDDFGIHAGRVRAVYAGPNFDPGALRALVSTRRDHPPTVLFVGLQFERKGGDVLVESFRRVRAQVPDARLLLAGVPPGHVEGPGITCLGRLDKNVPAEAAVLAEAYASAHVFALPTRYEPFGIAYVEAMHFGLPCIGPRAWAVPEIIADGETGFTVPVDDVGALSDRLLRLLRDPTLSRAMGEAGRERARRLFSWPAVVDKMTETMGLASSVPAGRHAPTASLR